MMLAEAYMMAVVKRGILAGGCLRPTRTYATAYCIAKRARETIMRKLSDWKPLSAASFPTSGVGPISKDAVVDAKPMKAHIWMALVERSKMLSKPKRTS